MNEQNDAPATEETAAAPAAEATQDAQQAEAPTTDEKPAEG